LAAEGILSLGTRGKSKQAPQNSLTALDIPNPTGYGDKQGQKCHGQGNNGNQEVTRTACGTGRALISLRPCRAGGARRALQPLGSGFSLRTSWAWFSLGACCARCAISTRCAVSAWYAPKTLSSFLAWRPLLTRLALRTLLALRASRASRSTRWRTGGGLLRRRRASGRRSGAAGGQV